MTLFLLFVFSFISFYYKYMYIHNGSVGSVNFYNMWCFHIRLRCLKWDSQETWLGIRMEKGKGKSNKEIEMWQRWRYSEFCFSKNAWMAKWLKAHISHDGILQKFIIIIISNVLPKHMWFYFRTRFKQFIHIAKILFDLIPFSSYIYNIVFHLPLLFTISVHFKLQTVTRTGHVKSDRWSLRGNITAQKSVWS